MGGVDFSDPFLVERFGSWVKVQVAFYDFIFKTALDMCGTCFNSHSNFADGEAFYDQSVATIEKHFASPEEAWSQFVLSVRDAG